MHLGDRPLVDATLGTLYGRAGLAVRSCLMLAVPADGTSVPTIDSLEHDG